MMRRWNGWGDDGLNYPLSENAIEYLYGLLGEPHPAPDASIRDILTNLPPSQLPDHLLVNQIDEIRLRHARGQSLPDWVALRSGSIDTFPDGVAYPQNDDQVRELLRFVDRVGAILIPYGGGTSVVGHVNPPAGDRPTITVNLSQISSLLDLDETGNLAAFGAGITGLEIERRLNQRGFTLGHYPQSFEYSTLGGWIATRSTGQQAFYYGRIEDLLAGAHLESPVGPLDLPPLPASAAGPDLRHVILGSEGRIGIITRATVRVRRLPQSEGFYGVIFHDWGTGIKAIRDIIASDLKVSMLRLSDPAETATTLRLSGKDRLVKWAERGLDILGYDPARCMLLFGVTGDPKNAGRVRDQVMELVRNHKGLSTGTMIGRQWRKSRFLTPYLRNTLWELGYALDTLETAVPWTRVSQTTDAIRDSIQTAAGEMNTPVLAFSHLSHVYLDGASIYTTYIYPRAAGPGETLARWRSMKSAASEVIIEHGGTISHQHGVGRDHRGYLIAEKGELGIKLLSQLCTTMDPKGLMNPGALVSEGK